MLDCDFRSSINHVSIGLINFPKYLFGWLRHALHFCKAKPGAGSGVSVRGPGCPPALTPTPSSAPSPTATPLPLLAPGWGYIPRCINTAAAGSAQCVLSSRLLRLCVLVATAPKPFLAATSFHLGLIALASADGPGLRRALYCA